MTARRIGQPAEVAEPAVKSFVKALANGSPELAIDLINSIPDDGLQKRAIVQFSTTYSQINPEASADWALASDLGDAEYDVGYSIAAIWRSRDASAASLWASRLSESKLKRAFEDALNRVPKTIAR